MNEELNEWTQQRHRQLSARQHHIIDDSVTTSNDNDNDNNADDRQHNDSGNAAIKQNALERTPNEQVFV